MPNSRQLGSYLVERSRNDSAARTFIERTSRYAMLARLDGGDTQSVLESFTKRLRTVPASLRKTVAYDQGTGTSPRETLAKRLKMDIDFCNPHGPWQRTADENANGLIRESLPKDTDLSAVANAELRAIEAGLNGRPRQMLRLESPGENFSSLKLNEFIGVALQA